MAQLKETKPCLKVRNLSHSFGPSEILEDINFTLEEGKVTSIVGPSGGGKTTLLHLCAGLLEVEEGTVENGFDRFAFAFQEARLLPWQISLDNIAFGLKAQGIGKSRRHQMAREISSKFGLEPEDLVKFPKDLSGGMRQRVSFARALVTEPNLLFLDEPFSALDIGLKEELQHILINQVVDHNLSILFITHDLIEAIRLSDDIILLSAPLSRKGGQIIHHFTIDTPIKERSQHFVHEEAAKLLAHQDIINSFELKVRG